MNAVILFELSEKFLYGSLSNEESEFLEKAFQENPEWKIQFEENITMLKQLILYPKHKAFAKSLKKAENTNNTLDRLYNTYKKPLFQRIMNYSSVAAVCIMAVLGTLYVSGWFSYKNQLHAYKQLSNSITTISKNQKSLWNNLFSNNTITYLSGTAFAISSDGYLATSYHLVQDNDSVFVLNATDSSLRFHAAVVATNPEQDVAILKISDSSFASLKNIPYTFNFDYNFELGNYVYSLGFSKNSIVFGEGSISSFTGFNEDTNTIQMSIPTNPGNSGSPVFNQYGEIVGIVCAKNYEKEGSSFAVKASMLKEMVDSLQKNDSKVFSTKTTKNSIKYLPKNKQVNKIIPYIFRIETY
jgi:S1-C subfamily serine protease